MNHQNISSSSSWIPYVPSSSPSNGPVHDIEAGRSVDDSSLQPEAASVLTGSSSTRPTTPKLSTSFMVAPSSGEPFSRPSLGRSATTPHLPQVRKRNSALLRLNTGNHTPREWSVFGQLMENEGQITPQSASFRRTSRAHSTRIPSGNITPRSSMIESHPSIDIQSPVAEEEFFGGQSPTDSDSDSESVHSLDSEESSSYASTVQDETQPKWYSLRERIPTVPVLYRNIFKCAVAYFIASLFTFNPYLSGFMSDLVSYGSGERRPLPSGHMVATVCVIPTSLPWLYIIYFVSAVYFNPAKTMGGMIEADFFCLFGILYSAFICLSSMSMFWWLDVQPGWEWLADSLAIVWVGAGMSFLAWMKVYMVQKLFSNF